MCVVEVIGLAVKLAEPLEADLETTKCQDGCDESANDNPEPTKHNTIPYLYRLEYSVPN
jgi:hypothetical protein